jgi:hypothetical protein
MPTLQVLAPDIGELESDLGSASHYRDFLFAGVKGLLPVLPVRRSGLLRNCLQSKNSRKTADFG